MEERPAYKLAAAGFCFATRRKGKLEEGRAALGNLRAIFDQGRSPYVSTKVDVFPPRKALDHQFAVEILRFRGVGRHAAAELILATHRFLARLAHHGLAHEELKGVVAFAELGAAIGGSDLD